MRIFPKRLTLAFTAAAGGASVLLSACGISTDPNDHIPDTSADVTDQVLPVGDVAVRQGSARTDYLSLFSNPAIDRDSAGSGVEIALIRVNVARASAGFSLAFCRTAFSYNAYWASFGEVRSFSAWSFSKYWMPSAFFP